MIKKAIQFPTDRLEANLREVQSRKVELKLKLEAAKDRLAKLQSKIK
jgi:hypothetical protein